MLFKLYPPPILNAEGIGFSSLRAVIYLSFGDEYPVVSCTQFKSGWSGSHFLSWLLSSMGRLRTKTFSFSPTPSQGFGQDQ